MVKWKLWVMGSVTFSRLYGGQWKRWLYQKDKLIYRLFKIKGRFIWGSHDCRITGRCKGQNKKAIWRLCKSGNNYSVKNGSCDEGIWVGGGIGAVCALMQNWYDE